MVQAVKVGQVLESQIDISIKRLFMVRYSLDRFDPMSIINYTQTPASTLESDEHKALALKMAQQSIVLLKNQNITLPLYKNLKKIIVLGLNANHSISILGNYNGIPTKLSTIFQGIIEKVGSQTEVVYKKAVNFINVTLLANTDLSIQYSFEWKQGFKAEYDDNKDIYDEDTKRNSV